MAIYDNEDRYMTREEIRAYREELGRDVDGDDLPAPAPEPPAYLLTDDNIWVIATPENITINPGKPIVFTNEQAETAYATPPVIPIVPPTTYTCPFDGQQFNSSAELTTHLSTEHGLMSTLPGEPITGSTGTIGGQPYTYQNGQWVPTGGQQMVQEAPLTQESPWAVGGPEFMEERYGRWPGFGTALGLYGRQYLSPYEQYMAGQVKPLGTLYDIAGRMSTAGGFGEYAPGGMFSQWAPQYAQDPSAMYGLAGQMMGGVAGMTAEQRAGAGMQYGGGDLSSLLQMALRPQLGKQTAGWLAGQLPAAEQQWTAQYPGAVAGAGQPSFLDYVIQKYNLGQYF